MVIQNEPLVTTASYIRSIIAVTKPGKLSEVDTRVEYMYSHIMCIVLMPFPNTGKDKQYMFKFT